MKKLEFIICILTILVISGCSLPSLNQDNHTVMQGHQPPERTITILSNFPLFDNQGFITKGISANPSLHKAPRNNSQLNLPLGLYLGDFNRDGISDFLQNKGTYITLYNSDYDRTPIILTQTVGNSSTTIKRIIVGDFNALGYDQVAFVLNNGTIPVYHTAISNDKLECAFIQRHQFIGASDDVIVGDFNGDRKDDLLIYTKSSGKINIYTISSNGFFFEVMPGLNLGSLSGSYANCRVRAGDFNGDGRDDLIFINFYRQIIRYNSISINNENKFQWSFTTDIYTVYLNEEVSVAKIDDDALDDLSFHNDSTGDLVFVKPEYNSGNVKFIAIGVGQISKLSDSKLYWAFSRGYGAGPGSFHRDDAIVYDTLYNLVIMDHAVWDGTNYTYWWAYTQYAGR